MSNRIFRPLNHWRYAQGYMKPKPDPPLALVALLVVGGLFWLGVNHYTEGIGYWRLLAYSLATVATIAGLVVAIKGVLWLVRGGISGGPDDEPHEDS